LGAGGSGLKVQGCERQQRQPLDDSMNGFHNIAFLKSLQLEVGGAENERRMP
jgi:hypothetical protein